MSVVDTKFIDENTGTVVCEVSTGLTFAKLDQLEFEGVTYKVSYTKTIVKYKDFSECNRVDKRTVYVRKLSNGDA